MATGYNLHANGIRLHLRHHPGEGPPLILVPGITSPAITWGFVADRLAARYDVHVLDVRGRGISQGGALDYRLDAMADDLLALTPAVADGPVSVLGHSMGARVAIRAARRAADRDATPFARLLLVAPPVSGPGRRPYPSPWAWYEDSIRLARHGCTPGEMRPFVPTWTEDQVALRAEWLATCDLHAVRAAYDGFHTDDVHADLPHVPCPMRLIVAGADDVIRPDEACAIRRLAPAIDIRTVEGAGHMIPWDDLDGFLHAVLDAPP